MSGAAEFLIVAAVLWMAFQLTRMRSEQHSRWTYDLGLRARAEHDDELRRYCPNLFNFAFKKDLREWQAVLLRKNEYFEDRADTLLDPHSKEPSSWSDVYFKMLGINSGSDDDADDDPEITLTDEQRDWLHSCRAATDVFTQAATANTQLTSQELHFITYWAWRDQLRSRDGTWTPPSRISADLLKMRFDSFLGNYARGPQAEVLQRAATAVEKE